ncbi:hypothetical protein JCM8097_007863 [Rhodosporidiobolus ruineniae]
MPDLSPELSDAPPAPPFPSASTFACSSRVGNGQAVEPAQPAKRTKAMTRELSIGLSPAPPNPANSTASSFTSSSDRKIDSVVYAGYEIQAQFASRYPLSEIPGTQAPKTGSTPAAGEVDANVNSKSQAREVGGRFGKKKAAPTIKREEAMGAAEDTAMHLESFESLDQEVKTEPHLESRAVDLARTASDGTAAPFSHAALGAAEPSPSSLAPTGERRPSTGSLVPDSQPNSAASQPYELPFSLPGSTSQPLFSPELAAPPTTNPPAPPLPHLSPAPDTTPALPVYTESGLPASPIASTSSAPPPSADPFPAPPFNVGPASAAESPHGPRGRGGRFLPKPAGSTQKAQRAAARAAKSVAAFSEPLDGTPHLTQRQQREIARKAREEAAKEQAEREKDFEGKREKERLFVCDKCFKYFAIAGVYTAHQKECTVTRPPGRRVYQRGATSIWEVDGATAKLYCQNLCLFAKLFIEHKYMFFDVEGFTFYLLTEATSKQEWVLGYFSKEKISYDDYNLACIVVFPPFRQKGWATLLIEFSYELSRRLSATPGTPERPLSDLGQTGYLAHWTAVLVRYFRAIFTLRAEPPLIDELLLASSSSALSTSPAFSTVDLASSPVRDGDQPRSKRPRRSTKGWDGELPAGAVAMSSALAASPAKAFTLRMRAGGPKEAAAAPREGKKDFDFPTTLDDLAEAVNLRAEDVAFALVESGLAQNRQGGRRREKKADGDGKPPPEEDREVKMEEDDGEGEREVAEQEEESLVVTPELVELVAVEKRVKPMPMLDVAYVLDV